MLYIYIQPALQTKRKMGGKLYVIKCDKENIHDSYLIKIRTKLAGPLIQELKAAYNID